ncbi:hypothetical protein M436DRAFT_72444 [Aureobasidium namibiae CBS 147.97]|uniref:BTB domain-containing protein n=1 Tax=Aureobasidium namibiae CBS 147.97 TaxID=1043004 RepID=A0A074WLS0_9PEZI|nr:uncharacterized protein M436DRAFT_72444 [Aureobasidium namibiae CBS 147.97]KEQ74063.1 hypothetical protein M436DRAFT_72444 [Aureobasidium namibiae CBS 147.97]
MSIRNSITGPSAETTVGKDSSAAVFNLPKQLLCESSTYFEAALNNGFAETATQKITLDDDDDHPEIFRTYAAWLFERELSQESIGEVADVEHHLFFVYIFADKRGIRRLANDVVTKMSSLWVTQSIDLSTTVECLPLLLPGCTLYELTLDNLILASRAGTYGSDEWRAFCSHPQEIMVELFKREQRFPDSFKHLHDCFGSICHYHEHEDIDEEDKCIKMTARGRNVHYGHEFLWDQVEWRW